MTPKKTVEKGEKMSSSSKILQWLSDEDILQTKEFQEEPTRKSIKKFHQIRQNLREVCM